MINKFDDDGTGLIEFTEFLCLMATKVRQIAEEIINCEVVGIGLILKLINQHKYELGFNERQQQYIYIFQMKEREQEEFESFIPFCFRAFADNIGSSLKVTNNYLLLS